MWAVVSPENKILDSTIGRSEIQAVNKFDGAYEWLHYARQGYTVRKVKVQITVEE